MLILQVIMMVIFAIAIIVVPVIVLMRKDDNDKSKEQVNTMEQASNLKINKYVGGLVVTIYKHNTKQVKKEISGIKSFKEAINVATI